MADKKLDILQRLQAGEISAQEALSLMNQMQDSPYHDTPSGAQNSQQQAPNFGSHSSQHQNPNFSSNDHLHDPNFDFHNQNRGWADGLFSWVGEMVDDITSGIKDMDIGVNISDVLSGNFSNNERTVSFASKPILQSLAQLELHGKNDKIEINAYDGDTVQIQCHYNARYPDAYVYFNDEGGNISLMFDDKQMRSVQVLCQVPKAHIGQLHAETKNDRIHMAGVTAGEISLATKNDKIYMELISCGNLHAVTTNDKITARGITASNIILETTNDKITAEDIQAQQLTLKTTNSGIITARLDVHNIHMTTTNTGLKLDNTLLCDGSLFWEGERTIEAHTTNGGIKFSAPMGIGFCVEASSSGGKVACDVPLYGAQGSKNHIIGESVNYATAGRQLRARLHTTNATIKIRE